MSDHLETVKVKAKERLMWVAYYPDGTPFQAQTTRNECMRLAENMMGYSWSWLEYFEWKCIKTPVTPTINKRKKKS
jgi:hypothetical protein